MSKVEVIPWVMVVHLRTAGDPALLVSALRQTVQYLDKNAAVFNVHTVQEELERSLFRERFVGAMTSLFGELALVLAAIGLYGLMAYGVTRRIREFGIRMAIGARAGSTVSLVLREVMWLLTAGIAVGLAATWALGRVIKSLLFGIEPADTVSIALTIVVLIAAALLAAWIPARRPCRSNSRIALPMISVRRLGISLHSAQAAWRQASPSVAAAP